MYITLAWKVIVTFNITAHFIVVLNVGIHSYFLGELSLGPAKDFWVGPGLCSALTDTATAITLIFYIKSKHFSKITLLNCHYNMSII